MGIIASYIRDTCLYTSMDREYWYLANIQALILVGDLNI